MPRPDTATFDALVREHHAAVFRSARRICGNDEDAADVAQEVFLRVLRGKLRLDRVDSERAVLCWLASRLAHNRERAARRRTRSEDHAMNHVERSDAVSDPAAIVAERDVLQQLVELVSRLPRDLRLPVQLRCEDRLTFAAIGTALRISESTAHERYERALTRLRQDLKDRGVPGVAALPLADLLGRLPGPVAPVGLEGQLLALSKASVVATAGIARRVAMIAFVTTAAVAVAVASVAGGDGDGGLTPASGTVAAAAAAGGVQDPQSGRGAGGRGAGTVTVERFRDGKPVREPAASPGRNERTFVGTVHDAAGFPVVGAKVAAVAGGGLKEFDLGEGVTDDNGAFKVVIGDVLGRAKLTFRRGAIKLRVFEGTLQLFESQDYEVPRPAGAKPLAFVLGADVGTESTRFALTVDVRDAAGRAVEGATVRLHSGKRGKPLPGYRGEAEAVSRADGSVVLNGRVLGAKWLFVDARAASQPTSYTAFTVDRPGPHKTSVTLAAAETLAVKLEAVEGDRVPRGSVWLEDEDGVRHQAETGATGLVKFENLRATAYTVHVRGWPWSAVAERGFVPRSEPYVIKLKRAADPRDLGHHMAEVHGRLVDAATGEEVAFGGFALEWYRRGDRAGESTLATDGCPEPPPVQRAAGMGKSTGFRRTGLDAGRWVLVADVEGYANAVREFELEHGQLLADVAVPLYRPAELHGRVVDVDGQPVERAKVFVVGVGDLADENLRAIAKIAEQGPGLGGRNPRVRWPSVLCCGTWTKADGSFELNGVPPDTALRLIAYRAGHELAIQAPNVHRPMTRVTGIELRVGR
ncbi:MAG: sigma-70 family RNA polymerase sigma factor [bacterium]|nr:sigma-70 family RNA polymerase sigma factor [bacterium]